MSTIGFDIGGTKIAGGVVSADGQAVERMEPVHTPKDQDAILAELVKATTEFRQRHPGIVGIGAGTAGMVEFPEGFIRWAPNNGYHQMPLRARLAEATGLPTIVDNDANVAAWAEATLGRFASTMLFVTLGTGVGGGIILDGKLFRGPTGVGAEIGHLILDPHSDIVCGCGNRGCLEVLTSGNALGRMGRATAAANPDSILASLAGSPEEITGETVFRALEKGDPLVVPLYAELGWWLGVGLASLTTLLDLELIVVGGSVAGAGETLIEPIRQSLTEHVFGRGHRTMPELALATLGPDAGWIGAGLLVHDALH